MKQRHMYLEKRKVGVFIRIFRPWLILPSWWNCCDDMNNLSLLILNGVYVCTFARHTISPGTNHWKLKRQLVICKLRKCFHSNVLGLHIPDKILCISLHEKQKPTFHSSSVFNHLLAYIVFNFRNNRNQCKNDKITISVLNSVHFNLCFFTHLLTPV